mmetsp:Transcript_22235/g.46182  ORF Transcript_22235/g.46182 Transcript_22235/m.46182 type:complete len:554 (+) Transcript_22235:222-1883(+)|eukprot:CAMPEP_0118651336 /NCGR_PEP_ID=MMETSP0785-20121206/10734_1 /TAXON_ID=91992 /ORGANISM="Bolidomonas pacifica, Strain CCMP 1866" /LENGTH=553 /DNA_ID=CAMNT_0006543787 /DNA_START=209 /DNA_END=1870 /DNA_ORIENTATION=+
MGNKTPTRPSSVHSSPSSTSSDDTVNRSFNGHAKSKSPRKITKQKTRIEDQDEGGGEEVLPPLAQRLPISILYGLINAAVVLPVMMSFGTIIYHDPVFSPYLPTLIKLTLVSSMVHQLCFSTFSSLPYSIGQVQDAGLIFLSAISSSFALSSSTDGWTHKELLATATIGLSLCTASLGLGLMLIGRCRLARFVQYLPTPVVGGYLAYIGFFCGQSGMGLMAGAEVKSPREWGKLVEDDKWVLVLPGIFGGLFIYVMVRRLKHMAVLPTCMIGILAVFYVWMWGSGMGISGARSRGWIGDAEPSGDWTETWKYIDFGRVQWEALPGQIFTMISMTLVVALSSCLDVAAIELELGKKLDYDHELSTVGLSNFVSGLTGGYSGSYIFSQTIFTLRSGVRDRIAGFTVAILEGIVVCMPFPIIAYIPKLFFGSLLVMICADLMNEWLLEVRKKVSGTEYLVAIGTFGLIMVTGVEWGILSGIAIHHALECVCGKAGEEGSEEEKEGLVGRKNRKKNNGERRSSLSYEGEDEDHFFDRMMDESSRKALSPLQVVENTL